MVACRNSSPKTKRLIPIPLRGFILTYQCVFTRPRPFALSVSRPSRLSLPSSQATASAKAQWISNPMMRMPAPPSLFVQSGSWRATRHLLIRAHGASGKVARGGHVTSSGSQPTVYRRPARTFVLPAPRVPDGLTISPLPFREQPDIKAPTDHIPDNGIVERFHTGCEIERAYVDKGYRGHDAPNPRRVVISGQKRGAFG